MTDDPRMRPLDEGDDVLAAELALGVLDGDERAAALRRVLAEPGFAGAVDRWRDRFAQLYVEWPDVSPPETLRARIERSLDGGASAAPRTGNAWRPVAIASMLVAACLVLVVLLRPVTVVVPPAQPPAAASHGPMLMAEVMPTGKGPAMPPMPAMYNPATGRIHVMNKPLALADRSAELWVIPTGGSPYALGLLDDAGTTRMPVGPHSRDRLAAGATLAVSIEPAGGSPSGQPTGPVVATGTLTEI